MSVIADDPGAELRALRERAYGPDADIHDDPAAMQRLRELEDGDRTRPASTASPDIDAMRGRFDEAGAPARVGRARIAADADPPRTDSGDAPQAVADTTFPHATEAGGTPDAPAAAADEAAEAGDADGASTAEAVAAAPDPPPWWRRRMPLLWAGSLVVAGLIGAAIALSGHAIGAGQVAVLNADPDTEWPEGYFDPPPEGAVAFEDFHGLVPVHLPQQMSPDASPSDCLYLAAPEADSFGFFSAACGAGPFPAALAILVTPDAPEELLDHYEPGTGLQFVLDGSQVRVYASSPVPGATP